MAAELANADDDDFPVETLPCDTLVAIRFLLSQFPRRRDLARGSLAVCSFALRSQIYASVPDRTIVDRELQTLRREGVVRTLCLPTRRKDEAAVLATDYCEQVEAAAQALLLSETEAEGGLREAPQGPKPRGNSSAWLEDFQRRQQQHGQKPEEAERGGAGTRGGGLAAAQTVHTRTASPRVLVDQGARPAQADLQALAPRSSSSHLGDAQQQDAGAERDKGEPAGKGTRTTAPVAEKSGPAAVPEERDPPRHDRHWPSTRKRKKPAPDQAGSPVPGGTGALDSESGPAPSVKAAVSRAGAADSAAVAQGSGTGADGIEPSSAKTRQADEGKEWVGKKATAPGRGWESRLTGADLAAIASAASPGVARRLGRRLEKAGCKSGSVSQTHELCKISSRLPTMGPVHQALMPTVSATNPTTGDSGHRRLSPNQHAAGVLLRFRDSVLQAVQEPYVSQAELLRLLSNPTGSQSAKESDVSLLMSAGFIIRRDGAGLPSESYYFSIPGVGPVLRQLSKGRQEMLKAFKLSKHRQLVEASLEAKRLSTSSLGVKFHIRDLVGLGWIQRIPLPSGTMLRLSHNKDAT